MPNTYEKYEKRRSRNKWLKIGAWAFIITGVLQAIDIEAPWPLPLHRVPGIIATVVFLIVGFIMLSKATKPKDDEVVDLAQETGGWLTVFVVHRCLGIPMKSAAHTLNNMFKNGLVVLASSPSDKNIYNAVFRVPTLSERKKKEDDKLIAQAAARGEKPPVSEPAAPAPAEEPKAEEQPSLSAQDINDLILGNDLPATSRGIPLSERLKNVRPRK